MTIGAISFSATPVPRYADGFSGAPIVAAGPQVPTLFAGYAVQPPWNVAGVNYPVGQPDAAPNTSIAASPPTGTSYSSSTHILTITADNVTLNGYDFTVSGGVAISCTSNNNLTVTNCKFGGTNLPTISSTGSVLDFRGSGLTFTYNTVNSSAIDGSQYNANSPLFLSGANGAVVVRYNYFTLSPAEYLGMGGCTSLDYQFNVFNISVNATQSGSAIHTNLLQWNGTNAAANVTVQFNTAFAVANYATGHSGEGFQVYGNNTQTFTNINMQYNTILAPGSAAGNTMSYLFHGTNTDGTGSPSGTNNVGFNYVDITGADGAFYPSTFTASNNWTHTGNNINVVTGATINPT